MVLLIAALAGVMFFLHLGQEPLTDWDESWHAQVASDVLQTGDWLSLHYGAGWKHAPNQGSYYFNKPPLSFWFKAIAFKIGGINEASARFFPALFGWGITVIAVWFLARHLGATIGLLTGLILCGSWRFVLYHAGRSAEADSTLLFFTFLSVIALFHARGDPRWFYIAGLCTAAAWFCKTSSAYLPWPAAIIAILMEHPRPRVRWRHLFGGLALGWMLTGLWQIYMMAQHGQAFTQAFYWGEGFKPLTQPIEDHPGPISYYLGCYQYFFQPWLLLAGAGLIALVARPKVRPSALLWVTAWTLIYLLSVSLFATKLIWYGTPTLVGLAVLAAWGAISLARQSFGWIVLIAIAALGGWQINHIAFGHPIFWFAGTLVTAAMLIWLPTRQGRWQPWVGPIALLFPLALNFQTTLGIIISGKVAVAGWDWELRSVDDPWHIVGPRIASELPPRTTIWLLNFRMNRETYVSPAIYFYLHRACPDSKIERVDTQQLAQADQRPALVVSVDDLDNSAVKEAILLKNYHERFRERSLAVFTRDGAEAATNPLDDGFAP